MTLIDWMNVVATIGYMLASIFLSAAAINEMGRSDR